MEINNTNTIFAIVMVSLIPITTLCILFNLLVLISSKQRAIDLVTCTLLIGRLGHACAVVLLMGIYILEHWSWSRPMCQTFVWLWITFWMLDVFTNLFFLIYNATRVGHSKTDIRCHMFLLLLTCWGLAILAGALTFITDSMFNNFEHNSLACTLGLSTSENPIVIGTMLVMIIGGLLILVLTISISAETRSLALKCKLSQAQAENRRHSKIQNGGINSEPEMMELSKPNGSVTHQNGNHTSVNMNNNSNVALSPDGRVYHWAYVDNQMRDVRHIHGAASATTILLNMVPQLSLYAVDIISGTPYLYTHHILVAVGLLHSLVLPVTLCSTGVRYRETSRRLLNRILGRAPQPVENDADVEQNIVFHIRDVTTTDSSDNNSLAQPGNDAQRNSANYKRGQLQVISRNSDPSLASTDDPQQNSLSREQIRESLETVQEEGVTTTTALVSSSEKRSSLSISIQGTVNPGYIDNECDIREDAENRPDYVRSQSDGVVDYGGESDEDWDGSWDSDSETWSNLYDYSDIEEVLGCDGDYSSQHKLSPNVSNAVRRGSRVSHTGSKGHRRRVSSQVSLPIDGQSPNQRERRKSDERRRRRRSKKKGRRGSRDLVDGLESTMGLGIASSMLPQEHKSGEQTREMETNTTQPPSNQHNSGDIPPPPALPNFDTYPQSQVLETNIDSEEESPKSEFASQLAAAALKLRHSKLGNVQKQPNIVRKESGANVSRKTSLGRKANIAILPDKPNMKNVTQAKPSSRKESLRTQIRMARKLRRGSSSSLDQKAQLNEKVHGSGTGHVQRTDSRASQRSDTAGKNASLLRKHSSGKTHSRISAPPAHVSSQLDVPESSTRPVSAPELDPALANMTLAKILTNPFLKDMLRQSLESLDSLDDTVIAKDNSAVKNDPQIDGVPNTVASSAAVENIHKVPPRKNKSSIVRKLSRDRGQSSSSSVQGDQSRAPTGTQPSNMKYYEIPNIDSDRRYRPKKPIRRGIHAFRAAAQAVIVQEFLAKAMTKPAKAPKPTVGRADSGMSWSTEPNNDLAYM